MPRCAPPYTVSNRKEPFNINGLHVSQNRPETVFSNNRLPFTTLQNRSNRPALLATRRSSYRFYSLSIWICHSLKCLTKKCLTRTRRVDRAVAFPAAPITQAVRWRTYSIDRLRGTALPFNRQTITASPYSKRRQAVARLIPCCQQIPFQALRLARAQRICPMSLSTHRSQSIASSACVIIRGDGRGFFICGSWSL